MRTGLLILQIVATALLTLDCIFAIKGKEGAALICANIAIILYIIVISILEHFVGW